MYTKCRQQQCVKTTASTGLLTTRCFVPKQAIQKLPSHSKATNHMHMTNRRSSVCPATPAAAAATSKSLWIAVALSAVVKVAHALRPQLLIVTGELILKEEGAQAPFKGL